MYFISVIVIYLDSGVENSCISSNFGFFHECTIVHVFLFAMLDRMDRTWVLGRLFSCEHIDGVKEFMNFIQGKFSEDEQILWPCGRYLN
jgi:hypothetical protein